MLSSYKTEGQTMSRNRKQLSPNVAITRGDDHVLGKFCQLTDERYAMSEDDEQGEGYVFEWDEEFGLVNNLIGATVGDVDNDDKLLELANKFAETLL